MDVPDGQENIMSTAKDPKGVGSSDDVYDDVYIFKGNEKFGVIETQAIENFYSCVLLR